MDEQRWLDAIQETMLIVLSICRLIISREHVTIEKSGIILIITLINGADLLAMSHSLQYHDIIIERLWMYAGLVILIIGLFQMAFIDTDGLTPAPNQRISHQQQKKTLIYSFQSYYKFLFFSIGFIYSRWSSFIISNIISCKSSM
jgi:hypothetical protein